MSFATSYAQKRINCMQAVREAIYWSTIMASVLPFMIYTGLDMCGVVNDPTGLSLALLLLLRSTLVSPEWKSPMSWRVFLSAAIEGSCYGGSIGSHLLGLVSILWSLLKAGFVLKVGDVRSSCRQLGIEARVPSALFGLTSFRCDIFVIQLILYLQSYLLTVWLPGYTVSNLSHLSQKELSNIVIEGDSPSLSVCIFLLVSIRRNNPLNVKNEEKICEFLKNANKSNLIKLFLKSLEIEPKKSSITLLLSLATSSPSHSTLAGPRHPAALQSNEAYDRVVINEAIFSLIRTRQRLGDKRFASVFDRSVDAKSAMEVTDCGISRK
jgi:hypothetical protein